MTATDGFVERAVLEATAVHTARLEMAEALAELATIARVTSHSMVAPTREAIMRARAALATLETVGP